MLYEILTNLCFNVSSVINLFENSCIIIFMFECVRLSQFNESLNSLFNNKQLYKTNQFCDYQSSIDYCSIYLLHHIMRKKHNFLTFKFIFLTSYVLITCPRQAQLLELSSSTYTSNQPPYLFPTKHLKLLFPSVIRNVLKVLSNSFLALSCSFILICLVPIPIIPCEILILLMLVHELTITKLQYECTWK